VSLLTRASDPRDQKDIERASGLSAIEIAIPEIALSSAEVAIPTITNCRVLRESEKVRSDAMRAPIVAATVIEKVPIDAAPIVIARVAPKAAPAEVPIIEGSASGLFVADCESAPATPNERPTRRAAKILGNLMLQMISCPAPDRDGLKMNFQGESILALPTLNANNVKESSNVIDIASINLRLLTEITSAPH
jgi:hypothetical protein